MGRKPDVLIATYFNRGDKLQDSSNRYSYTCKGCGILFPRGRINHLLNHLIGDDHRCPALTAEDLANILAVQASKSAEKANRSPKKRPAAYSFLDQDLPAINGHHSKRQAIQPSGDTSSLSGLEALAEASRRVEQPFDDQIHGHNASAYDENLVIDPSLSSMLSFPEGMQSTSSDLSGLAASANMFDESAPLSSTRSTVDDQSNSDQAVSKRTASDDLAEQLVKAASFHTLIAAKPDAEVDADGLITNSGKNHRARKKFTVARREEVRGVRSKHACIRCRMLRKPCSADDPCTRCSAIKNPRIWSSKCVRGRLPDLCDLYSARLNAHSVKSLVNDIQQRQQHHEEQAILQVKHERETISQATFDVTAIYASQVGQNSDQLIAIVPGELGQETCAMLRILLAQMDVAKFPSHAQRAIVCGQSLGTESERQLFRHAESVYRCTRLLVTTPSEYTSTVQSNGVATKRPNQSPHSSSISLEYLALKSMVEFLARQDCHTFLKDLELALVNRSLPPSSVLVSAIMFFFSLELLEFEFRWRLEMTETQGQDIEQGSNRDFLESLAGWLVKLDEFASFMQDLLRSRHIIGELEFSATGILCASGASKDVVMKELFVSLQIDRSMLEQDPNFNAGDADSLFFKRTARLLLSSQARDLLSQPID